MRISDWSSDVCSSDLRLEMVEGMQRRGRISRAWHRGTLAAIANFAYPLLINPKVYPDVGINRLRGLWAQQTSPNYRVNLQFMSEPMIRFFHEAGMMEGKFTMAMLRATRSLPADLRYHPGPGSLGHQSIPRPPRSHLHVRGIGRPTFP